MSKKSPFTAEHAASMLRLREREVAVKEEQLKAQIAATRPDPNEPQQAPVDSFAWAFTALDQDSATLLRDVMSQITLADFPGLKIDTFKRACRVAMVDLWGDPDDWTDSRICREFMIQYRKLAGIRRSKAYKIICEKMVQGFEELGHPLSYQEHLADHRFQDRAFREERRIAFGSGDVRTKQRALQAMREHGYPVPRMPQDNKVVVIDASALELLMSTQKMMEEKLVGSSSTSDEVRPAEPSEVPPEG
jgi:hypothetical protein